jgi:Mn2+/Fe2+ NRAMP family transporter
MRKQSSSAFWGAAFLMATSAIGPGFITQTTKFTHELLASFGFVIVIALILDIGVQLNIWRILGVSQQYAPQLANQVFKGAGALLTVLIVLGSLVFNVANVAGAGLGMNVLLEVPVPMGAAISAAIAIAIFAIKEMGKAMDWFARVLGFLMIGLTVYVAFQSKPPIGEALLKTVWPDAINQQTILTIVGGTVGGYISFAGIHRLLDRGVAGAKAIPAISKSAVNGILVTSLMRFVLFLAVLGVVVHPMQLDASNPAASVFATAAGQLGYRLFGFILWSAAITSVVGAAFTAVSFLRSAWPLAQTHSRLFTIGFIVLSATLFLVLGKAPANLLVVAGAINGCILPIALAIVLLAAGKQTLMGGYRHPLWLQVLGWLVVLVMGWMALQTIFK